jgi:AcrR family transcriptional regulator
MADIIQESGMSKGSVYFHFASKEALAVAVLEDRHSRWIADVERTLSEGGRGELDIGRLLPAVLSLHQNNPDAWVVSRLTQNLAEIDSTRQLAASLTRRWVDLIARLIRDAAARQGNDLSGSADTLAMVFVAAFDGLKLTAYALSSGDLVATNELLVDGGRVIERMLSQALGREERDERDQPRRS